MTELTQQQIHQIWMVAAERVKDRVVSPTLYRAVELGVGVTIEEGFFVLGFTGADMPMAGHLRSSQHLSIIEQCVSEVAQQKLRLKIIEGTTMQDYLNQKSLQETREHAQFTISEQRAKERAMAQEWESVGEQLTRGYARLQQRQFAQIRGQFIIWGFGIINDAVNKFGYSDESDDVHKRALARIFERFGTIMEVPATMLAYEFLRLREDGKLPKK